LSALNVAIKERDEGRGTGSEGTSVRQIRFYATSDEASPLLVAITGVHRRMPMAEAP
jgi:type VI protein secretion system component Hcp